MEQQKTETRSLTADQQKRIEEVCFRSLALIGRNGSGKWFHGERIANPNTHGTGCTLSSAIACGLAQNLPLTDAVEAAKRYLTGALEAQLDLGQGSGPLDHMWRYRR